MDNKARPGTAHRVLLLLWEYTPAIIFKWTFSWLSPCSQWHTIEDRERCERKEGEEVLRWDWGGLMRRRELPLSLGETGMPTVRRTADTGIRSFRNSAQPLHTNCSSSPPAAPLSCSPSHFIPLSKQVGGSSETGWHGHRLPLKSLKGNWAFQLTPLICGPLASSVTKTEGGKLRTVGKNDSLGHNMLIGSLQLTVIRKVEAIRRRIIRKGTVR